MADIAAIDRMTPAAVAGGLRIMQGFLLAATPEEHVARLLALMNPPTGAAVVDAGCGIGEVARLMHQMRPDLEFTLVNLSQVQLDAAPAWMPQHRASFTAMPLPDKSVDVVMFNFAVCQEPSWEPALREARRVLREGGTVFIYDMVRVEPGIAAALESIGAYVPAEVGALEQAKRAGFTPSQVMLHRPRVELLRPLVNNDMVYGDMMRGVMPCTWRLTRMPDADPVSDAFARHDRVAFHFSGGRDSTAALFLMRPYWDRMTVYHVDTGDQFPETREVVAEVRRHVPVTVIHTDVEAVRQAQGWPSDLVPVDNQEVGQFISGRPLRLTSRYACCVAALMKPMQDRMRDDGITLLIRGQRDDDYARQPARSGDVKDGFEVLYPIQDWTGEMVSDFLQSQGLPIAAFYERGVKRAPECMGCTAWWDEGRAAYMKEYHPVAFDRYAGRMRAIKAEIDRQYGFMTQELGE